VCQSGGGGGGGREKRGLLNANVLQSEKNRSLGTLRKTWGSSLKAIFYSVLRKKGGGSFISLVERGGSPDDLVRMKDSLGGKVLPSTKMLQVWPSSWSAERKKKTKVVLKRRGDILSEAFTGRMKQVLRLYPPGGVFTGVKLEKTLDTGRFISSLNTRFPVREKPGPLS